MFVIACLVGRQASASEAIYLFGLFVKIASSLALACRETGRHFRQLAEFLGSDSFVIQSVRKS